MNKNGFENSDTIRYINSKDKIVLENNVTNTTLSDLSIGKYTIQIGNSEHTETLYLGGVYSVLAIQTEQSVYVSNIE